MVDRTPAGRLYPGRSALGATSSRAFRWYGTADRTALRTSADVERLRRAVRPHVRPPGARRLRLRLTQSEVSSRTVDIHVAELRRKLEPAPAEPRHILTVEGGIPRWGVRQVGRWRPTGHGGRAAPRVVPVIQLGPAAPAAPLYANCPVLCRACGARCVPMAGAVSWATLLVLPSSFPFRHSLACVIVHPAYSGLVALRYIRPGQPRSPRQPRPPLHCGRSPPCSSRSCGGW